MKQEKIAMKSAKLLLAIVAVLLASSAWAQTLRKDREIKVRTDSSIPAKPEANAKYDSSVSKDVYRHFRCRGYSAGITRGTRCCPEWQRHRPRSPLCDCQWEAL